MAYVTKFRTRLTRSARGELFNPLIYPFILTTLGYGLGFTVFRKTEPVAKSSLHLSMTTVSPTLTLCWGIAAVTVIIVGLYVLVKDKPPLGKANCFVAFMLWFFASIVYIQTGGFLTLVTVSLPSLYFWTWQYFSLSEFRRQDVLDRDTMRDYDSGGYDDDNGGEQLRLDNRGVSEDDRTE